MHSLIKEAEPDRGGRSARALARTPPGAQRSSAALRRPPLGLGCRSSAGQLLENHALGSDALVELEVSELGSRRLAVLAGRRQARAEAATPARVATSQGGDASLSARSLAEQRGYDRATLMALAEVGHHYLRSGGLELARLIFEGLSAVAPTETYFVLARAFVAERQGDRAGATELYREAIRLAPSDPCPEVNLAELALVEGAVQRARRHLAEGQRKARECGDVARLSKAEALLARLGAVRPAHRAAEVLP